MLVVVFSPDTKQWLGRYLPLLSRELINKSDVEKVKTFFKLPTDLSIGLCCRECFDKIKIFVACLTGNLIIQENSKSNELTDKIKKANSTSWEGKMKKTTADKVPCMSLRESNKNQDSTLNQEQKGNEVKSAQQQLQLSQQRQFAIQPKPQTQQQQPPYQQYNLQPQSLQQQQLQFQQQQLQLQYPRYLIPMKLVPVVPVNYVPVGQCRLTYGENEASVNIAAKEKETSGLSKVIKDQLSTNDTAPANEMLNLKNVVLTDADALVDKVTKEGGLKNIDTVKSSGVQNEYSKTKVMSGLRVVETTDAQVDLLEKPSSENTSEVPINVVLCSDNSKNIPSITISSSSPKLTETESGGYPVIGSVFSLNKDIPQPPHLLPLVPTNFENIQQRHQNISDRIQSFLPPLIKISPAQNVGNTRSYSLVNPTSSLYTSSFEHLPFTKGRNARYEVPPNRYVDDKGHTSVLPFVTSQASQRRELESRESETLVKFPLFHNKPNGVVSFSQNSQKYMHESLAPSLAPSRTPQFSSNCLDCLSYRNRNTSSKFLPKHCTKDSMFSCI